MSENIFFGDRQYGLEAEKVFVCTQDAEAYKVGSQYFQALAALKRQRGQYVTLQHEGDLLVGVQTNNGVEGLDGSFNMGESSTGPIADSKGGLRTLNFTVLQELCDVQIALSDLGAAVLNMSNHPLLQNDDATIEHLSIPRSNSYARQERGWNHTATINSRVQNSPSTSINAFEAAPAINVMIGLGAALIALYANSPFEHGKPSTLQETRLTMWEEYFAQSAISTDKRLPLPPKKPFASLQDYFRWIYGQDTSMYFVMDKNSQSQQEEKRITIVNGHPSVLEYLSRPAWLARDYQTGLPVTVRPNLGHMERNQFMQFCGVRLRYSLTDPTAAPDEFLAAMNGPEGEVESFMDGATGVMYLEGRDPGANFADEEIASADAGAAQSVLISPSAIQAGLVRNLAEAKKLVAAYDWDMLMGLREAAVKDGMQATYKDASVAQLCGQVLEVAAGGLASNEIGMLTYPEFVLRTMQNGASRARQRFNTSTKLTARERIQDVLMSRFAMPANQLITS